MNQYFVEADEELETEGECFACPSETPISYGTNIKASACQSCDEVSKFVTGSIGRIQIAFNGACGSTNVQEEISVDEKDKIPEEVEEEKEKEEPEEETKNNETDTEEKSISFANKRDISFSSKVSGVAEEEIESASAVTVIL